MGFAFPQVVSTDRSAVPIPSAEKSGAGIFRLWTNGNSGPEYFLVENRQQNGYDAALPASGLLIWHIDDTVSSGNRKPWYPPNSPGAGHYQIALVQSDNLYQLEKNQNSGNAGDPGRCAEAAASVARFRAGLRHEFESRRLDALIYPTWANPPRLIGDLDSPHGDNSQSLAPPSGFPAITVPMGWVRDGTLPVGLQFLGVMWDEGRIIGLAYAWEQATKHRRPPASAPPLEGGG